MLVPWLPDMFQFSTLFRSSSSPSSAVLSSTLPTIKSLEFSFPYEDSTDVLHPMGFPVGRPKRPGARSYTWILPAPGIRCEKSPVSQLPFRSPTSTSARTLRVVGDLVLTCVLASGLLRVDCASINVESEELLFVLSPLVSPKNVLITESRS